MWWCGVAVDVYWIVKLDCAVQLTARVGVSQYLHFNASECNYTYRANTNLYTHLLTWTSCSYSWIRVSMLWDSSEALLVAVIPPGCTLTFCDSFTVNIQRCVSADGQYYLKVWFSLVLRWNEHFVSFEICLLFFSPFFFLLSFWQQCWLLPSSPHAVVITM